MYYIYIFFNLFIFDFESEPGDGLRLHLLEKNASADCVLEHWFWFC